MKKIFIFLCILINLISFSQQKFPNAVIETTEGTIEVKLYNDTPLHSQNFVKLVNEGYYNGQLFHRVIKNFMIQSGDPNSINASPGQPLGNGGPGYTIPPEILPQYYHKKGALAAARQADNINPQKYSSGSQFYIVQGQLFTTTQLQQLENQGRHKHFTSEEIISYTIEGGTPHLDQQYTVFGEVVTGLEIVDKISKSPADQKSRPINDIRIIKAYIKK
jgi:cyclophilin family peptidyl-prolyl cis-trans isomerase